MDSDIKVIYFVGCPHAKKAQSILSSENISFEVIVQDDLPEGDWHRGFSSPTILKGEEIIWGSKIDRHTAACTHGEIDASELLERLNG